MCGLVFGFFVAFVTSSLISLGGSYNINPVGHNPKNVIGTHQWIAQRAVHVLALAGYIKEANFFTPYLEELANGTFDADKDGGYFEIFGYSVPRNSFGHFYNPKTEEGFRADTPLTSELILRANIPDGYAAIGLGPNIPSTTMCDWNYQHAVQLMRLSSNTEEDVKKMAIYSLGYAAHFIADATVPMHVTDCGAEKSGCNHQEYEAFIQENIIQKGVPRFPRRIDYIKNFIPSDYVKAAAELSLPRLDNAKSMNSKKMMKVGADMIPVALSKTAALYKRFYDQWKEEQCAFVVVRIDRIIERKGVVCKRVCLKRGGFLYTKCLKWGRRCKNDRRNNIEGGSIFAILNDADFQPEVTIDNQKEEIRGYSIGLQEVRPRSTYFANGWTFGQWISKAKKKVEVRVCLWDIQRQTGKREVQVDIANGSDDQKCVIVKHKLGTNERFSNTGCDQNGVCKRAADIDFTIASIFPIAEVEF